MSSGMSSEKAQPKNVTRHKITHPCKIYPFPLTRDGTSFFRGYLVYLCGIGNRCKTAYISRFVYKTHPRFECKYSCKKSASYQFTRNYGIYIHTYIRIKGNTDVRITATVPTFNLCTKCVGISGIIHACPFATQFPGHGCIDDLTTESKFDSQATWIIVMLGLFLTCYPWVFVKLGKVRRPVDWCMH